MTPRKRTLYGFGTNNPLESDMTTQPDTRVTKRKLRDTRVTERKLRGRRLYFVAYVYNDGRMNGTGQTPLDAIRDLLDQEESAKLHASYPVEPPLRIR